MPYGLSSAPSVFQCLINDVLRAFLGKLVIAYIDDILIYSANYYSQVNHVCQVIAKLQENHLYINEEKCKFHATMISFLGYIFNQECIIMDQNKVHAITKWPTTQSIKDLQHFIWFANFYWRFIQGFSIISAPLTALLKATTKKRAWSKAAERPFSKLKQAVTTAPIIHPPDPECPFRNRSGIGIIKMTWGNSKIVSHSLLLS